MASGEDSAGEHGDAISARYATRSAGYRKYASTYALANLGMGIVWGAVLGVLLPLQVQQLELANFFAGADASVDLQALNDLSASVAAGQTNPTGDEERLLGLLAAYNAAKANSLSLVTSVGVFVTMLIQPVTGMLSDRTRSRWGRRAPWIAGGAVVGGALICLMPVAPSLAALVIVWSLAQSLINVAQGPLNATVADRVPPDRIGRISSLYALVAYVGSIGGAIVAGVLFQSLGLMTYYLVALSVVTPAALFVLISRDQSSQVMLVDRLRLRDFAVSFVAALRDHDYRWAWTAKVLLMSGLGASTVYSIYMLQSYVVPAVSVDDSAVLAPLIQFAAVPGTLVAMAVSGRWSDRSRRRKPFVVAASGIMAFGFVVPLVWPTVGGLITQAVVTGIGFGAFLVVDQALFIDVLPHRDAAGRDLGLAMLGQNLGQAIGPVVAGAAVAIFAGSYAPVWVVAFVLVAGAALAILPVRRVR